MPSSETDKLNPATNLSDHSAAASAPPTHRNNSHRGSPLLNHTTEAFVLKAPPGTAFVRATRSTVVRARPYLDSATHRSTDSETLRMQPIEQVVYVREVVDEMPIWWCGCTARDWTLNLLASVMFFLALAGALQLVIKGKPTDRWTCIALGLEAVAILVLAFGYYANYNSLFKPMRAFLALFFCLMLVWCVAMATLAVHSISLSKSVETPELLEVAKELTFLLPWVVSWIAIWIAIWYPILLHYRFVRDVVYPKSKRGSDSDATEFA